MQNTFEKLSTSDREATFFRAVWLQLAVISLLKSCLVACVSTAHLTHSNSTVKVTANVRWLSGKVLVWTSSLRWCTKLILTYKLLLMALVSHFSLDQIDTINLYSMAHCLRDLWTQQTPATVGAFGHWYHLVSLALSLAHTILFLKGWIIRSCLQAPGRETVIFMGCDLQKVMMQM